MIGIDKESGEKIELKDYMYNIETDKIVTDENEEFTHYFYDNPNDHLGFKIIHKDWVKEVIKNGQ